MLEIAGALVGGIFGYGYYRLVGCASGACPIQSNPWISTLYWAVMGGLIASLLLR
jgi:hypothetical protein